MTLPGKANHISHSKVSATLRRIGALSLRGDHRSQYRHIGTEFDSALHATAGCRNIGASDRLSDNPSEQPQQRADQPGEDQPRHPTAIKARVEAFHVLKSPVVRADIARRCASGRPVRLRSFASVGVASCRQYRRGCAREHRKSAVTIVGRPTHLTVTCSPTSQNASFGSRTPRHSLRPLLAAACGRPSASLAVTANGRVTPPPRSSPKFSGAAVCATSK